MIRSCFLLMAVALLGIACSEKDAFEAKRIVAKELLGRECNAVVKAATREMEKKHDVSAAVIQKLAESRCGCMTDSLAVQFAKDFSLEELQQLKDAAGDSLVPMLEKEMEKSAGAVGNCLQ